MNLLLIPFSVFLSIVFTGLLNPLSMGLTLLLQTLIISLIVSSNLFSFWMSYILFMIFIGGMLVLFIYVASLAANEYFKFSFNIFFFSLLTALMLSIIFMFTDQLVLSSSNSLATSSINEILSTPKIVSWIYNAPFMNITLFIILYLLLTLIVVVKITKIFKGPLRLT